MSIQPDPLHSRRTVIGGAVAVAFFVTVGDASALEVTRGPHPDWDTPDFRRALDASLAGFFGDARGDYVRRVESAAPLSDTATGEARLVDQFRLAFGIPLPEVQLPDGYRLIAAAQPHNAQTLAVVVTQGNSSQVVVAALLHFVCGVSVVDLKKSPCATTPVLTVFYPRGMTPQAPLTRSVAIAVWDLVQSSQTGLPASHPLRIARFGVSVLQLH